MTILYLSHRLTLGCTIRDPRGEGTPRWHQTGLWPSPYPALHNVTLHLADLVFAFRAHVGSGEGVRSAGVSQKSHS